METLAYESNEMYNSNLLIDIVFHQKRETDSSRFTRSEPLGGADIYTHEVDTKTFRVRVGSVCDKNRMLYVFRNLRELSAFLFGNENTWVENKVSVRALVPLHTYDEDSLKKMESIIYESGGFCRRCYDTNDELIVWGVIDFTSF